MPIRREAGFLCDARQVDAPGADSYVASFCFLIVSAETAPLAFEPAVKLGERGVHWVSFGTRLTRTKSEPLSEGISREQQFRVHIFGGRTLNFG